MSDFRLRKNEIKKILLASLSKELCRSKESLISYTVTFRNLLDDPIRLYWLDFGGNLKFYGALRNTKATGEGITIDTFVTHPWVALHHQSGELLSINFKRVFRPVTAHNFLQEAGVEERLRALNSNRVYHQRTDVQDEPISGRHVNAYITPAVLRLEVICCLNFCKIMTEERMKETTIPKSIVERILSIRDSWMV